MSLGAKEAGGLAGEKMRWVRRKGMPCEQQEGRGASAHIRFISEFVPQSLKMRHPKSTRAFAPYLHITRDRERPGKIGRGSGRGSEDHAPWRTANAVGDIDGGCLWLIIERQDRATGPGWGSVDMARTT
jgi:hypothetical protein